MAKTRYPSVNAYIAAQPKESRPVLERVRSVLRKALPKAEETISYQIPAYKLDGRTAIYFAGWKAHYSIYPATDGVVAAFGEQLVAYEMSKGTIRFPLSEPVPATLIAGIAKVRAAETAAGARAGVTTIKKRSPAKGRSKRAARS